MQIQRFCSAPVLKFMLEAMPWEKHKLLVCLKMKTLGFYLCTLMHGTNALCASKNKNYFLSSLDVWGQEEQSKPCHREELSRGFVGLEKMGLDLGQIPVLGAVQAPPQQPLCPCSIPQHDIPNPLLTSFGHSELQKNDALEYHREGQVYSLYYLLYLCLLFPSSPLAVRKLGVVVKAVASGWCFKSSPS